MLKIVTGDLFDAEETYLCHQCNCVTNRAAHLAKAVFQKFPYSDVYTNRVIHNKPGTIAVKGDGGNQRFVVGLFGQYYPGYSKYPTSERDRYQARLSYFKSCLEYLKELKGSFAFPWRIGCGAAGGDWIQYLKAIRNFEKSIEGTVIVYRLPGVK